MWVVVRVVVEALFEDLSCLLFADGHVEWSPQEELQRPLSRQKGAARVDPLKEESTSLFACSGLLFLPTMAWSSLVEDGGAFLLVSSYDRGNRH